MIPRIHLQSSFAGAFQKYRQFYEILIRKSMRSVVGHCRDLRPRMHGNPFTLEHPGEQVGRFRLLQQQDARAYLQRAALSSTMGPGVRLDLSTVATQAQVGT